MPASDTRPVAVKLDLLLRERKMMPNISHGIG